jgi:SNF2 family DNA or RNA helicase
MVAAAMTQAYHPRAWQPLGIDHIVEHRRCALWAGMGLGKTSMTLTALDQIDMLHGDAWPALALGPLRVARKVWSDETRKWHHTAHLEISRVVGTQAEREAALKRPAHIYSMNYENVAWLRDHLEQTGRMPFRTIISDESRKLHAFRVNQGGAMTRALHELAWHDRIRHFIELTGTPSPNGLKGLWGQLYFLDRGKRLGLTYESFENRWFAFKRVRDAVNAHKTHIQPIILPNAHTEIHDLVKDLCLSIDARDWFDLKAPIKRVIEVEMPEPAMKLYRQMERDFFVRIENHEIEAFNAASKSTKLLQLAGGAAYLDPDVPSDEDPRARAYRVVHDAKLEALASIVEEAEGMPLLVFYSFKSDVPRIQKLFPKARVLKSEKDEDDFKAGKIDMLLAHPKSAGHGIDGFQHVTNIAVFFNTSWDLELRQQAIERIGPTRQMQAGLERPVWLYDIVAKGTIDELVLLRHETKRSVQDLLIEATKRGVEA